MNTLPWLINTVYDNNITIQELAYGQDIIVRSLDNNERLSLQRRAGFKVTICSPFGQQMVIYFS